MISKKMGRKFFRYNYWSNVSERNKPNERGSPMTFDECCNAILDNIEQTNRSMLTAIKNVEEINKTLDASNEKVKNIKNSLHNVNYVIGRKKNIKSREIIFKETYVWLKQSCKEK